jgi:DNA polymerase-1
MHKKVCLIDGSGYIFRAFYALPSLTAPDGTPVNAVLGFLNMFMRLTGKIPCDYCLVLFDAKRQNFRNDIFPDYKGTRKDTPEELILQFPLIRQAVDILSLNHLEIEGFEADDLIASYARQSVENGHDVVVVSADKDLMQLIRPHVEFYDSMKDKFFTPEDVKEKFGVYPDRVVDVQSLAGDAIDNVPGVPGIGLKTAAELVNRFGSLEGVLNGAGEITQNKRRETLLAHLEDARLSEKLVRLKDDISDLLPIEEYVCRKPEKKTVMDFITQYGLRSIQTRAEKWVDDQCVRCSHEMPKANVPVVIEKNYELIQTEADLKRWIEKITQARSFSLDVEATGENPQTDTIIGLALATDAGQACYIPLVLAPKEESQDLFSSSESSPHTSLPINRIVERIRPLLASRSILKIGHNIKTAMHFLEKIVGSDCPIFPIEDTAVMSYVLDSSEHAHDLPDLTKIFLDEDLPTKTDLLGSTRNKSATDRLLPEKMMTYAAPKADMTGRLYRIFKNRLISEHKISIYENFDRPLIPILQKMESAGVMLDPNALLLADQDLDRNLKIIEKQIYELAGEEFNLASPKQVGEILYGKLGLKGKKTASGGFQTKAEILERLAEEHELPAKILEWRRFSKLKSTYTQALLGQMDHSNRVHTTYLQTVVNTGRLASANPNLQNIPIRSEEGKKIRACFVARSGCRLIAADYSQVELRLLAEVADVKALKDAFLHNVDIHTQTAAHVFGILPQDVTPDLRRHAKAINFGIVYGISAYGLAKQIGTTPEEAKKYIDSYFAVMPEIKTYMEQTIAFARQNGYVLTPYGRRCFIAGIQDTNKRNAAFAERAAINAPIQGGAADIIKRAMIDINRKLEQGHFKTKMLLQVHDELIFEAPDDEVDTIKDLIKNAMENVVSFDIPFIAEVGIGHDWAQAH